MATQTILPKDRHSAAIQAVRPGTVQNISFNASGSTKAANALQSDTVVVRLMSTVDCYVAIGPDASVTATTGSMYLPAFAVEYFSIPQNDRGQWNVAARGVAASGTLNLVEAL